MAPRSAGAALPALCLALLALAAGRAALAQAVADPAQELVPLTQRWLDEALLHNPPAGPLPSLAPAGSLPNLAPAGSAPRPLRLQVSVGALDARLRLAPCARVEPYLPAGAQLWGRTRLGLRCVAGVSAWNVFLPIAIAAFGPAWVLTRNVAPGALLTAEDATEAEVDWAAEPAPVLANPALWQEQVATRQLRAGQALRQTMVRAPWLFPAGAQVKVQVLGPGYAVVAAGQALSAGATGQMVRVRMDNGRIVSGMVNAAGTIDAGL
ncbi:flagella basal body P-ring formation protein FlgA [Verminephrobacter eiseniae]|nr:flagella basal body P-ring formation protein FlgA [Verminephrobacter eiseniae]